MGSLGVESTGRKKKAMWLYPKVVGFNPTERWGHSACCLDGVVYVFGGCCGGSHFGDVVALDVEAMSWAPVATTGEPPGTRDSHTAALVGHRMVVFGGTDNGSRKVDDVHVLDLRTRVWRRPRCSGEAPCARESHTATVVGGERVVVFGGSGGGRYLNDVHVLDVGRMEWTKAETRGVAPVARDSHTAVAVGNKVVVYGGDCGDRYHGEVDVLDVDTMTWSTLVVQGPSPGVRAGHAAVTIGTKVYIIGGVGDKHYYGDVWVLDLSTCSWSQIGTAGQRPQGRFSHTAVVTNNDIAIYGGCGEDERPLNELLVLQLGSDHPNGRYNVSMCKIFGSHWSQYKHKFIKGPKIVDRSKRGACSVREEAEADPRFPTEDLLSKRVKTSDGKPTGTESELEEHSLSLSQGSSPSHSDHEQNTRKLTPSSRESARPSSLHSNLKQHHDHRSSNNHCDHRGASAIQANGSFPFPAQRAEQFIHRAHSGRHETRIQADDQRFQCPPALIGAEVFGTVDGAFDSGYLMTANVNGQIFRGVLFAPGPSAIIPRPVLHPRCPSIPVIPSQPHVMSAGHAVPLHARPLHQNVTCAIPESAQRACEPKANHADNLQNSRLNGDLQGVVLTLGGPGGCG